MNSPDPTRAGTDANVPDEPTRDEALRRFMALREHAAGSPARRQAEAQLQAWLQAGPANRQAYEACLHDWARLDALAPAYRTGAAPRTRPARWRPAAAALGLAGMAVGAMLWHAYGYGDFSLGGPRRFTTALEQQRAIDMRDGSRIQMDVGSALAIAYTDEERRVRLIAGNVYFDVAADPGRPFIVETAAGSVRVLGTAFEVQQWQDTMRVAVARGRVRVAAPGGQSLVLAPGEAAQALHGLLEPRARQAPAQVAAWRGNRLVFDGAPLAEVAQALSRRGAWTVQVDEAVAALPVTLTVRLDDVANALAALPDVLPLSVTRSARLIRISARAQPPVPDRQPPLRTK